MEKETWSFIETFIKNVLKMVQHKLDAESIEAVEHYIYHNEFEMAYEILFIEIMKIKEPPEIDFEKSKEIALQLNLNKETIYDEDFWSKFQKFIHTGST